jgi:hypothetical protein
MYSKFGWYARVGMIWVAALAAGCGISYLLFRLPWHPYIVWVMDMALWITLGFALAGPWSYESYLREQDETAWRDRRQNP